MSFKFVYFPRTVFEKLQDECVEYLKRGLLTKKNSDRSDIYVIGKSRQKFRLVFQAYRYNGDNILVFIRSFDIKEHDEYEKHLAQIQPIISFYPEEYVKRDLTETKGTKPDTPTDDEMFDAFVSYRQQIFPFTDEQYNTINAICEDNNNAIIVAGAGAGKTVLAEKILFYLARQHPEQEFLYICPPLLLAEEMRTALNKAKVENIFCLSLLEITSPEAQQANFDRFCQRYNNINIKYHDLCEAAASQVINNENVQPGNITKLLNAYNDHVRQNNLIDLNLGIGFPFEQLNDKMMVLVDEYQQVPIPLLIKFKEYIQKPEPEPETKTEKRIVLLGDPYQTLNRTSLARQHILPSNFRAKLYQLQETHRSSASVSKIAEKFLVFAVSTLKLKQLRPISQASSNNHGQVFVLSKKQLDNRKITMPIDSKVLCLSDDEIPSVKKIFGETSVYYITEALGLEFEHVIIFIPDILAQFICSPETFHERQHLDYQLLMNALYVAITRAKTGITLVLRNSEVFCSKTCQTILSSTVNRDINQFLEIFSKKFHLSTVIQYIQQEINAGYIGRAKQIYQEHVSKTGDFFTFCVANRVRIQSAAERQLIKHRTIDYLKMLCLVRQPLNNDLNFIIEQSIQLKQYEYLVHALRIIEYKLKLENNTDIVKTFCNHFITIITNPEIREEIKSKGCALLSNHAENLSREQFSIFPALCDLIKTASNEETEANATMALAVLLPQATAHHTRIDCIVDVYPALCGLIETAQDVQIKTQACSALVACLKHTAVRPTKTDCIVNVYPVLCGLIETAQDVQIKTQACSALTTCLMRTAARPRPTNTDCIVNVYPVLCDMVGTAQDVQIKTQACSALIACLMLTAARPTNTDCIVNVYPVLCNLIIKEKKNEMTTAEVCLALTVCFMHTAVRPTRTDCIVNVYPVLCDLIKTAQDVQIKTQACSALAACLKHTAARPISTDCIVNVYPVLCNLIEKEKNEMTTAEACSALAACVQQTAARHTGINCIVKLYPVLCKLIKTIQDEQKKTWVYWVFAACLREKAKRNDNIIVSTDIYRALCDSITGTSNELTKYHACSALEPCLLQIGSHTSNMNFIQTIYPALCDLIQNAQNKLTKYSAYQALTLCLKTTDVRPTNADCIEKVYSALSELLTNTQDEEGKTLAYSALLACLKRTNARPTDSECISKIYDHLSKSIQSADNNEIKKCNAAMVLSICLQEINAHPSDVACAANIYPSLCSLIQHSENERIKAGACMTLAECLKQIKVPSDHIDCINDVYPVLCNLIQNSQNRAIKTYASEAKRQCDLQCSEEIRRRS